MTTEIINIQGFDADGEPEIRSMPDGSVLIVFNFMPPSCGTDDGVEDPVFDDFAAVLANALGVAVNQDDREIFRIASPAADTVRRAKEFLETFWSKRGS